MRVVGLTGGIGTGKSVVARMFADLGASVIDADAIAREVVEPGTPALAEIVEHFGPEVLDREAALDRKALGRRVFRDRAARVVLERIVHPKVALLAAERMRALGEAGAGLVVYDVPLLYENGLDRQLPAVVVVSCSPERQRQRVRGRDHLTADEVEARIAAQMPLEDKVRRANFVIDNDGDLDATRAQVEALYRSLTAEVRA